MKIALILVNMFDGKHIDCMQPIVFAILDRLSPGHELKFYDERVRALPDEICADLIALSVDTSSAARAYRLADQFRKQGKTVVMGGIHPSSAPEEALEHADSVVIGEAEDTWPQLLADLAWGRLQPVYQSKEPNLISFDVQHPALRGYLPIGLMETSRGCIHRCDFCSVKVLYPGRVRRKLLAHVDEELSRSPDRLLFFVDDNLFSDRTYFLHLTRLLRKHRKRWAAQVSLELAQDAQLLRRAKQSGAVLLLIGLESLHDDALKQMGKVQNRRVDLAETVRRIQRHGMLVYATFVFGYDSDTPERVREVLRFGIEQGIAVVNFNPLQPMPGTAFDRRLRDQGRLKSDHWWLDPRFHYGDMAFEPLQTSSAELTKAIEQARRIFYSPRMTLRRWWNNPAAHTPLLTGLHVLLSRISRQEIRRKQGRSFHETDAD